MALVLEIEYLTGTCFAALGPESEEPDWPPQPDRIFSALVATWAARGEAESETKALKWLEAQAIPMIQASDYSARTAPETFVPPNDPESGRSGNKTVMPTLRRKQPRRFPAARPSSPIVRLIWSQLSAEESHFRSLQALAADTAYIGHSASLTRCQFRTNSVSAASDTLSRPMRGIYPGRFAELRTAFGSGRRPLPGIGLAPASQPDATPPRSDFDDRWVIFEYAESSPGGMPDLRAAAIVAKTFRDTLLSGYQRLGLGQSIPEAISGHEADGSPSRKPHLAIVPLAFAGFPHADGHVLGFALIPPREYNLLEDIQFMKVLRSLSPVIEGSATTNTGTRRLLTLKSKIGTHKDKAFAIDLSPVDEALVTKSSLYPWRYTTPANTFATVTPLVLDRYPKSTGQERNEEIANQVKKACRNIGLPEPIEVIPDKHSAIEGAPSAWGSGKAPHWVGWRVPGSLSNRPLTHAFLRFEEKVKGPVLIGAGRYCGMGLCLPLNTEEGP